MLDALIQLVIYLVIVGIIWWGIQQILPMLPLPAPIPQVINVILTVVLVLIVVYALLGLVGHVHVGRLGSVMTETYAKLLPPAAYAALA